MTSLLASHSTDKQIATGNEVVIHRQSGPSAVMTVPQTSRIRISEKEDLLVTGIRLEHWRCAVTLFISLLTFGLPVVLLAWRRDWKMAVLYRHCPLREAKRVVIEVN